MAILWAGQEDIDFPKGKWPTRYPGWQSYGRHSLDAGTAPGSAPTYMPCISVPFPAGAVTSCWVSARAGGSTNNSGADQLLFGLTKSTKTMGEGLWLKCDNPVTKIVLCTWNGTAIVELALDNGNHIGGSAVYHIDMQVISYGASATVNVYVDGILAATFTGDVRISSLTDLDQVAFYGDSINGRWVFSEFIVADEDTRPLRLTTLYPNAAGDSNAWTGAYTVLDEEDLDVSDLAYVNTSDQLALYNLSATPAGTFAVKAVQLSARALKSSDSIPTNIALGVKSGGSTDAGSDQALTGIWATYQRLMTTNPLTSNPWTTAELDALQLQLKSRA